MGNDRSRERRQRSQELSLPGAVLMLAVLLCWGIFWPPQNTLAAAFLGIMVMITLGWLICEAPRLYKIIRRDDDHNDTPTGR